MSLVESAQNIITLQEEGAGYTHWSDGRGNFGTIYQYPSLGGGFGQGLLQGLQSGGYTNPALLQLERFQQQSTLDSIDSTLRNLRWDQQMREMNATLDLRRSRREQAEALSVGRSLA